MLEPTDIEIKQIKEVEKNTLDQLKIIQQELHKFYPKINHKLQ